MPANVNSPYDLVFDDDEFGMERFGGTKEVWKKHLENNLKRKPKLKEVRCFVNLRTRKLSAIVRLVARTVPFFLPAAGGKTEASSPRASYLRLRLQRTLYPWRNGLGR